MYEIALSAVACARSGTRAFVAWMLDPIVTDDALLLTPGGGRIGAIAGGAFDGLLADVAAQLSACGRHATIDLGPVEAAAAGLSVGTQVRFLVVPVDQFPGDTWARLLERQRLAIDVWLSNDMVTQVVVHSMESSSESMRALIAEGGPTVHQRDDGIVTVLSPVTRLVIAGSGPIADALKAAAQLLGWKVAVDARPDMVMGMTAALTRMDAVVVMGHDVEQSSRNLMAALDSGAGYIGALGSRKMQDDRAQWLAYRDVTDLARVNGPAGLNIKASTPAEIAVSVLAEAIYALRAFD